jgi:hypothetical protein
MPSAQRSYAFLKIAMPVGSIVTDVIAEADIR